jgi:hypothetical protein
VPMASGQKAGPGKEPVHPPGQGWPEPAAERAARGILGLRYFGTWCQELRQRCRARDRRGNGGARGVPQHKITQDRTETWRMGLSAGRSGAEPGSGWRRV